VDDAMVHMPVDQDHNHGVVLMVKKREAPSTQLDHYRWSTARQQHPSSNGNNGTVEYTKRVMMIALRCHFIQLADDGITERQLQQSNKTAISVSSTCHVAAGAISV